MKKNLLLTALTLAAVLLTGCSGLSPDPHAGMVEVSDGGGGTMWVDEIESLPKNELMAQDFSTDARGFVSYTGEACTAVSGIDVSYYQGQIDWQAVAASGVRFAIIRAGYRGYTEGQLFTDEQFYANIEGARENGLDVGVYFFSQALTAEEAQQEAEYVLDILSGYELQLPVFFDWEPVDTEDSRTQTYETQTLTDCARAFCTAIEQGGYEAGVYFFRYLGYYSYDLEALSDWDFWAAALGQYPDFHYAHTFWQYSITGTVPGIEGSTDLNLWFRPAVELPQAEPPEQNS